MASPFKARIFWLSLFGQRPAHIHHKKRSGRRCVTRKSNRIYKMCAYFMPHRGREGKGEGRGAQGVVGRQLYQKGSLL